MNQPTNNVVELPILNSVKRPFPFVRVASEEDLSWDPEMRENFYYTPDGQKIRSGNSYAVTRPGHAWPLGQVARGFKPGSHRARRDAILAACEGQITPAGALLIGHGYHVVHAYNITHSPISGTVGTNEVHAKLVVTDSYTGGKALKGCLVLYVGKTPVGTIVKSKALHVASQPTRWAGDVDAMIEKAILAQGAILDLLNAASNRKLVEADRDFFDSRKMVIRGTQWKLMFEQGASLLDAVLSWMRGAQKKISWGTYERRLNNRGLLAMVELLGRKQYGQPLDDILGTRIFG